MRRVQASPAAARSSADSFRPDLEGLRGVAILLVLAFHAGIPGIGGGFIGVDVFYVLSGFLITGLLLRERERTGRISLSGFYARRARRILPAAAVVLVLTLVAAAFVISPLDLPRVARDAVAVALSAGNIRFALGATDYFASDLAPSPFLHYWSLGVEEQFYLVWPALLILAMRLGRPRVTAAIALVGVIAISYAASFYLTDASAAWAFYSLPTRAWQLALGGLIAAGTVWHSRVPDRVMAGVGCGGLFAVVAAGVLIDPTTMPYPGVASLAPTLGAGAVILAGGRGGPVASLLAHPWLRFLGKISFSLYLVHWPLLVLPATNLGLGEELPFAVRMALVAVAIVAAWASYHWIEEPFHRGRRLSFPAGRTVALGGATIVVTAVFALGVGFYADHALAAASGPDTGVAPTDNGTWTPSPTGTPGATGSPAVSSPSPAPTPTPSGPQPLPANLRPSLAAARNDWEKIELNGCTLGHLQVTPTDCVLGDPQGTKTVALVGDSHAAQWFPALDRIAKAEGWKLIPYTKLSCRFLDMRMYSLILKREYYECTTWRKLVVADLQRLKPDLVVVAAARDLRPMVPGDADPRLQGLAMARFLVQIPGRIAILADTPQSDYDIPACLALHRGDMRACETPRAVAFGPNRLILEQTAATASGATLVDLSDTVCSADPCPVVSGNLLMWRDSQHFTATYAASLAGALFAALPSLGAPSASPPGSQ
jgi:peptidoglycan/LPS O-acetylase OafA/YrhL